MPASIFESSRMSLMICIIVSAAARIESTKRRWRLSRSVPASSSAMPSTPFIGVRISWLMLARNSSLERITASDLRSFSSISRVRSRMRRPAA